MGRYLENFDESMHWPLSLFSSKAGLGLLMMLFSDDKHHYRLTSILRVADTVAARLPTLHDHKAGHRFFAE